MCGAGKYDLVGQLLAAKEASGKTFTQISQEIGLTNAYTAQLFYNQVGNLACFTQYLFRFPRSNLVTNGPSKNVLYVPKCSVIFVSSTGLAMCPIEQMVLASDEIVSNTNDC